MHVEDCTDPETYDYFSNSETSFILTFTGLGIVIFGKKWKYYVQISVFLTAHNNTLNLGTSHSPCLCNQQCLTHKPTPKRSVYFRKFIKGC